MKNSIFLAFLLISHFSGIIAQSLPSLSSNAPTYNFVLSIAENFNAGRRFEEINQNLPSGTLGNLSLPTNFSSLSLAQRALYILNAERTCRNNVNYSTGLVKLLPFQSEEVRLSQIAQAHADWLVTQNKFDHCGNPSLGTDCSGSFSSPTSRIQSSTLLKDGWEGNSENIGLVVSSSPNSSSFALANEKTIYDMLYRNAPNWAHRANFLKQTTDNYGTTGQEGFLGVGEKQAVNYNPLNTAGMTVGKVVVYSIYDPKPNANNSFSFVAPTLDITKTYQIIAKHSNKALTALSNSQPQAIVQSTVNNATAQKWQFVPTANGYFQIKSVQNQLLIDTRWGGDKPGTRLNLWAKNNSSSQEWKLVPQANGSYKIVNKNGSLCMSVPINMTIDIQLVLLNSSPANGQEFLLVEVTN
ncbi:MAG: RICIN domain-containing protein [Saprospiraceae bacterium]|nr:RICIN domain-containing protein [Saprospiraceae bacterium]